MCSCRRRRQQEGQLWGSVPGLELWSRGLGWATEPVTLVAKAPGMVVGMEDWATERLGLVAKAQGMEAGVQG